MKEVTVTITAKQDFDDEETLLAAFVEDPGEFEVSIIELEDEVDSEGEGK